MCGGPDVFVVGASCGPGRAHGGGGLALVSSPDPLYNAIGGQGGRGRAKTTRESPLRQ